MNETDNLETLSEKQCWPLLASKEVGRLAVSIQNLPDIFPVNYRVDGETIIVKSIPSLKLVANELGEGVAFEVYLIDELHHTGWSIVVRGVATEIASLDELRHADRLHLEPAAGGSENRYLRITASEVVGRRLPV